MLNSILNMIAQALKWVVALLPDSPFQVLSNSVISEYLPLLNWLFPFSFILSTMQTWLSAVLVYYAYSAILRWVKAVK